MFEILNINPYITATILALGLGAVVGLEREAMIQREKTRRVAGIRTFAFICMMGAISGIIGQLVSPLLTVMGFLSVVVLVAIGYKAEQKQNRIGLTTEITSLIIFLTGILTAYDQIFLAVVVTIAVITVLSHRQYLHGFASRLENQEMFASIKFAIIAFIILPLLPNQTFDPWGALNPHKIWLIIVLISGLNFAGYILSKVFGERKGMALTGFFGGFASSTAVNLILAEQSKSKKGQIQTKTLLLALFLAQVASLILTEIELFVLNKELFIKAIPSITTVIVVLLLLAYYSYKTCTNKPENTIKFEGEVNVKSPFTLSQALMFGGIFSAMMLTIKILFAYIGNAGLYITSLFSGLISLDAMTVTIAETSAAISLDTSLQLLILGIIASIIQKIIVLFFLANKQFRLHAAIYLTLTIAIFGAFAWLG
ncbi:MAG: DUF4010 domain-containing protein [Candidatus Peregrinibacteria bacterium]|nr:DUF4010 domain-containing protein [Candidatus Peregrinibacteria bacterium]MDZ4244888.1 DUF4010 domain-containing protein [Candidatus Gracilibacteria bacterium]